MRPSFHQLLSQRYTAQAKAWALIDRLTRLPDEHDGDAPRMSILSLVDEAREIMKLGGQQDVGDGTVAAVE